jgi:predicted nucleotidyltransferase
MADIHRLISSRIRVELLRILVLNPESALNINELSRRAGFSLRGVDKELKNLLMAGILRREIAGNQHLYQLDPSCPIQREIKGIVIKTVGITALLTQALRPVEQEIDRAFVYGSFASGDYGNDSDVDLFVVTELSGLKLAELLGDVQNEIGRPINVSQFTLDEFNRRKEQNDHFLTRVLEGSKIGIIGDADES